MSEKHQFTVGAKGRPMTAGRYRPILALCSAMAWLAAAAASAAEPLAVTVLVKPLDEVAVPAREAGVLAAVQACEGMHVEQGEVLATIDDTQARFLQTRAGLEMAMAAKQAASDIGVVTAEKSEEVAKSAWQRAVEANKRFPNSISKSELDRLELDAEKAVLAVRQARLDREIAQTTHELKRLEHDLAASGVERRTIVAAWSGMVVELLRRRGEWVQPGDKVLRILRLDQLRAEGFLDAQRARSDLAGRTVRLKIDLPERAQAVFSGKLVFVSPEVDPVNRQVRILAEIDNPDLTLRPGLQGTMIIGE